MNRPKKKYNQPTSMASPIARMSAQVPSSVAPRGCVFFLRPIFPTLRCSPVFLSINPQVLTFGGGLDHVRGRRDRVIAGLGVMKPCRVR